jgi:hypothetical protein
MQLRITKIEPKRFWAPKYDESTTEDILRRCYNEILLIQKNLDLPDGYWEGYYSHSLINYVREAHAVEGSLSNTVAYDQMERITNNTDTPADSQELKAWNFSEQFMGSFLLREFSQDLTLISSFLSCLKVFTGA